MLARLDRQLDIGAEAQADSALELPGARPAVDQRAFRKLYDEIELPLVGVLARMERDGDPHRPGRVAAPLRDDGAEIHRLTAEIYALAGKAFNINSPQQLGQSAVRGHEAARAG